MGRVYLCLGKNAEVPFYFEHARVHVWNVEELCYFIKEHVWALEPALLSKELADWVGNQCALAHLAARLEKAEMQEKPMEAFVRELFEYTGYYAKDEYENMEKILSANSNSDELMRQKARGDYFLESGKYGLALLEYDELLQKPIGDKSGLLAAVWHNRGAAQAGMFWFDKAADSFEQAYKITQSSESARQHLAAKRLLLTTQEYVDFLAQRPDLYQASLELEKKLEQCESEWTASQGCQDVERALEARRNGAFAACEEMVTEQVRQLQEEYRQAALQ